MNINLKIIIFVLVFGKIILNKKYVSKFVFLNKNL